MPHSGAILGAFDNEGDRFRRGSVADDSDVGAVPEGVVIHIAVLRDAHFGETGAIPENIFPNHRHRWWDGDAREALATIESTFPNLRNSLIYFCSFVILYNLC